MTSIRWHLSHDHAWRQFWMAFVEGDELDRIHDAMYPECEIKAREAA